MKISFSGPGASTLVPDGTPLDDALARVTHLGIGAHQDDLEIMAYHGIARCVGDDARWFGGITCTDGAGSPRAGAFADFSDEQMKEVRRDEQNEAARLGEYGAMVQLGLPSDAMRSPEQAGLEDDLFMLLERMCPRVVYTHNLADKHETHVAVGMAALRAMRRLPAASRPREVYGCETWRDLDWMVDSDKVAFDLSPHENLQAALVGVFDSQICGGKRYDLATQGRRRAHATYHASHGTDESTSLAYGMDLTPLVQDAGLDPWAYVSEYMDRFADEVKGRLAGLQGEGGSK